MATRAPLSIRCFALRDQVGDDVNTSVGYRAWDIGIICELIPYDGSVVLDAVGLICISTPE